MPQVSSPRSIALVLYPGCALLDVVTPLAELRTLGEGYRITTVASRMRPMSGSGPVRLLAERTFDEVGAPAAILVPGGGASTVTALSERPLIAYLQAIAEHAEILAAIGSGSLLLGAAGLLQGRRATTPPEFGETLEMLGARYVPEALVEEGRLLTASDSTVSLPLTRRLVQRLSPAKAPTLPSKGDPA